MSTTIAPIPDAQGQSDPGRARHSAMPALDLLRALAAAAVMTTHIRGTYFVDYSQITNPSAPAYAFFAVTRIAHEAVMVFFVLSGFLVGGRVLDKVASRTFSIGDYTIDRVTRILLPLVPACLFSIAVLVATGEKASVWQTLANMIGLNGVLTATLKNNAPLWSLAYEIWFYVAAGALGYLFVGGRRKLIAAGFLALSVVVFVRLGSMQYLLFWVLGAFAVLLIRTRGALVLGIAGVVMTLLGVALYQVGAQSNAVHVDVGVSLPMAEAIICLGLCAFLPLACGGLSRVLRPVAGALTFLGGFSYSLYLVHMPLISLMEQGVPRAATIEGRTLTVFALRWLACIALALIFYALFERQTGRVRRLIHGWVEAVRSPLAERRKAKPAAA
jgi:peptidoglycan/LPS O-acetylase OafA/YrhL